MSRLVLTRRLNETVVIQHNGKVLVEVKVCRIDRNQVRIAFVADPSVIIDRKETLDESPGSSEQDKS
jgi:carbon storage regulator CsrA